MSRTACTFGRTSTHMNARWLPREERVLDDECPPEQVRDARDEEKDDHLAEARLIKMAANRDARHERQKHRYARHDPERQQVRGEKAEGGVGITWTADDSWKTAARVMTYSR